MARTVPIHLLPGTRGRIPVAELRRIARHVLAAEGAAPHVEVEVVLADADTVQELNRLYRGKDEPTDVLSFAQSDSWAESTDAPSRHPEPVEGRSPGPHAHPEVHPEPGRRALEGRDATRFIDPPDATPSLGEVIICVPFAEAQAAARNQPVEEAALGEGEPGGGRRFQISGAALGEGEPGGGRRFQINGAALGEAGLGGGRRFQINGAIAHLLVHGLLHLLAYDHEASEPEADRMQAREDELLSTLGYAGAYEHGH